jgi:magnesium transporter
MCGVRRLATSGGVTEDPTDEQIRAMLEHPGESGYWLDIQDPQDKDLDLLRDAFHFHPLAIRDIRIASPRPKLYEFPGYAFLVLFTATWRDRALHVQEQHLFLSPQGMVSVHDEVQPAIDELFGDIRQGRDAVQGGFAFDVADNLVSSIFPVIDDLDSAIDELQDRTLRDATPQILAEIYDIKHDVTKLHRLLGAQLDAFQRLITDLLQERHESLSIYFRSIYDHTVRQFEIADSLRDLLSSVLDVYLSSVSNRLNVTMKQLTVIASVFLPLSFLTGFFGMNFTFLVNHIGTTVSFFIAMVVMGLSILVQILFFKRRGWI